MCCTVHSKQHAHPRPPYTDRQHYCRRRAGADKSERVNFPHRLPICLRHAAKDYASARSSVRPFGSPIRRHRPRRRRKRIGNRRCHSSTAYAFAAHSLVSVVRSPGLCRTNGKKKRRKEIRRGTDRTSESPEVFNPSDRAREPMRCCGRRARNGRGLWRILLPIPQPRPPLPFGRCHETELRGIRR